MHLEYHGYYTAPAHWIVIDDYGTEHNSLWGTGDFGGSSDAAHRNRWHFEHSGYQDPDYCRAHYASPTPYWLREDTAFASQFGFSIEVRLCIDLLLHPAWDADAGEPRETRGLGARIEILSMHVDAGNGYIDPVTVDHSAIEEFCWAYIDMYEARQEAERQQRRAHRAAEASQ